ncbi:MAG TPA: CBS domain-containing protein, partial [Allocoleopsis sp.]
MQLSSRRLIQPCPLILSPDTTIATTVKVMSQVKASCVLVVEQQHLVGIFTERDFVRTMNSGAPLTKLKLGACMTQQVRTLKESEL